MSAPFARAAVAALPSYAIYAAKAEPPNPVVRCDKNENPLGAPQHVVDALRSLSAMDYARYPSDRYAKMLGLFAESIGVAAERTAAACGADELLSALIGAFAGSGDNAVMMSPAFAWYERFTLRAGARPRLVPYPVRWLMRSIDILARCDDRTRLIILANPNNPTGDLLPPEVLTELLSAMPRALVVVDETYVDVSGQSVAPALPSYQNLAVVRTLSKVAGLAGLRAGFLAAAPSVAEAVRKWLQPYPVSVSAAAAAIAFFGGGEKTLDFLRHFRETVGRSLRSIAAACEPIARCVYPSAGNFILVDFGERIGAVADVLAAHSIRARRYEEPQLATCMRFSAQDESQTHCIAAALRAAARNSIYA